MGWPARRDVTRVTWWVLLFTTCPAVAVTAALRPAAAFLAAACGTPFVWVLAVLLTRDRPPWHRCPPRHARRGHADPELRAEVADISQRLSRAEQAWAVAGILRRGAGQHKRDFRVIDGGGEDDDPGDSRTGLASLHAAG